MAEIEKVLCEAVNYCRKSRLNGGDFEHSIPHIISS